MKTSKLLPTPSTRDWKGAAQKPRDTLDSAVENGATKHRSLLQEDSPASLFPKLGKEEALATTVTSGQKCLELYKSSNRHGSSLKTCVGYLLSKGDWYSNKSALTWKTVVTKSNRLLFQLSPSTHRTEGIESGLSLKTPSASEAEGGWKIADKYWEAKAPKLKMRDQVGRKTGLKLQPNFVAWMMGYPLNWANLSYPKQDTEENNLKPTETP